MAIKLRSLFTNKSPIPRVGIREKGRRLEVLEQIASTSSKGGKGIVRPQGILNNLFGFKGEDKDMEEWKLWKRAYMKIPIVAAAINIAVDQAIQNFTFEGDAGEVKKLEELKDKLNLLGFFHNVAKQMLIFGNAFVEVVRGEQGIEDLKILNPVIMFVNRDKFGNLPEKEAYFQFDETTPANSIAFDRDEIIHFKWNPIGEAPYGTSLLSPLLRILQIKVDTEENLKLILDRYAAPIIHVKVGTPERPAQQGDIDNYSADLEDLKSDTEFVTSEAVEMNVVDAHRAGVDLEAPLTYIERQVVAGLETPLALLGRGEGTNKATAEVQLAAFDRRIRTIQRVVKEQSEDTIFEIHLGSGEVPKMIWEDPDELKKQAEMDNLVKLKQAGIITAQKANDLLPKEFSETLPEMPQIGGGFLGQQKVLQKDMAREPQKPMDRIQKGKEKRNPKKVKREEE